MDKCPITIKDIAKYAGVSKSTVSRVINNSGYVSAITKKKVNEVIADNFFRPSAIARNLSTKDCNYIGVVIPEAHTSFFAEVVSGISEIADKNGYVIMYCDTNNDEEKEERALLLLRDQGIKGLILTPARDNYSPDKSKHIKQLIGKINVPVVFVDRKLEKTQMWDGVYIDHFNCAYIATQSLIEDGYKNIAIITPNLNLNIGAERLRGYIQALTDNGITIRDEYIFKGDWSNETSYNSTKQILKMNKLPD
ncbi:MAG: LacI family DNA-binding transcriptional regulator, partial [Bacillota bacterium]